MASESLKYASLLFPYSGIITSLSAARNMFPLSPFTRGSLGRGGGGGAQFLALGDANNTHCGRQWSNKKQLHHHSLLKVEPPRTKKDRILKSKIPLATLLFPTFLLHRLKWDVVAMKWGEMGVPSQSSHNWLRYFPKKASSFKNITSRRWPHAFS